MVYGSVIASLPSLTLWLLAAGGVLYSMGVIFHLSSLAEPAFSERDLAWFRASRG
jgi:predicted membrane channel-forming protein YqfA (hemolysin III family)